MQKDAVPGIEDLSSLTISYALISKDHYLIGLVDLLSTALDALGWQI